MPIAWQDFPLEKFPITIQALHPETRAVVWELVAFAPPPGEKVKIHLPPLKQLLGHPVTMRFLYADGTSDEAPPPVAQ